MAERELVNGANLIEIAPLLGGELVLRLAYFLLEYVLFTAFENIAKRRGTLEVF